MKLSLITLINLAFFINIASNTLVVASDESKCNWNNKNNTPCLLISTNLSNSSKYSKNSIYKKIITKKQIIDSGAIDLIDVLKLSSDINITQSGSKGQQASMFMRGTNSNHTLVMINGVQINDQSTTQGLHDFGVDFIQTIQQVEIYPGSSGAQFGANAIGGAINIILTGNYKNYTSFASDKDTNYELTLNKSFINDDSVVNIKFGSVKNDTISARGSKKDEKDKVINYSTNLNYEKYLKKNKKLISSTYIRQTISDYDNSSTNQYGYTSDNRMGSFQIGMENKKKTSEEYYKFYYNIYDRQYDERNIIDNYKNEVFGLKYDYSKILNEKISYGLGSDYNYNWGKFQNNGFYSASTKGYIDTFSLYANAGWNLKNNVNLSIFGRSSNHENTGKNSSYKINLEKKYNQIILGTSLATGYRNPTLYELYGTDNYGYSGNKNLKPEKSETLEVYSGVNLNKKINFSLRGFKSTIKNNIEYISNKYQNDDDNIDLNQLGLNAELNYNYNNSALKLMSSILSSKKENGSDQLRRPQRNYTLNYNKKFYNNLNLNLTLHHYGSHYDSHSTSFKTIKMKSNDLVNLKISKKIGISTYFFKISNLLNESYQKPHGYNQEKRVIKFGINY